MDTKKFIFKNCLVIIFCIKCFSWLLKILFLSFALVNRLIF